MITFENDNRTQDAAEFNSLIANNTITDINNELTQAMTKQRHQALIKGERLDLLLKRVDEIVSENNESPLAVAAVLGRLAAVARSREDQVYKHIKSILKKEPLPLDTLADGDEKYYAAVALSHVDRDWVRSYCIREGLSTDTAEKARRELLSTALRRSENATFWLDLISDQAVDLQSIENVEARIKRARRVVIAMSDSFSQWKGELTHNVGESLSLCLKALLKADLNKSDDYSVFELVDQFLLILLRIIELRFSRALNAETYKLTEQGKKILGNVLWGKFLSSSELIDDLRVCLLEAALVLARQNKTDKQIIDVLISVYSSKTYVGVAIKKHFLDAKDLEPDVREWWISAGVVSASKQDVEQKVGNSEDQQIGHLLIEVEGSKSAMEDLRRSVVPLLEISDPILAATVETAARGYSEIAQITRRLARMRKLSKTNMTGESLEYNPLEHEMVGGHVSGIRKVRVVQDGVQKEFNGKIKTFIKARVEKQ